MDNVKDGYLLKLREFTDAIRATGIEASDDKIEFQFESLVESYSLHSTNDIKKWYEEQLKKETMKIEVIPLDQCKKWIFNKNKIQHESGEFFSIEGIRVSNSSTREVNTGWDQPIIKQTGWDGGILGLIRKRFNGVPHYLIEAKAEPGNPNIVQMSPTLQATFSNIKKSHKGRAPLYLSYFTNPEDHNAIVHYKNWLAEDGGRLFNKRNLNMLVELPEETKIDLNSNFMWMSMHQIKVFLHEEAWVNPHIRGIISHL